ncbi:hypothetical protein CRG98_019331 [Punica granatum]|uniref:Uncharacterized protein n=1 Tax=Punica granatum TaxID=22663 RepID=A0A2I0JXT8_PUNGR|nr:hypothetical protein CRG98_019331 [Punica granatum]
MEIPEAVIKCLHQMYEQHLENFKNGHQVPLSEPSDTCITHEIEMHPVPDLARKVVNVSDSLVKGPKTNSAAIKNALARVANDIGIVLREVENKAGSSTGQCDEEASTSNSEYTLEEKRTITELKICVVDDAFQLIKPLTHLVKIWNDAGGLSKTIGIMEGLLIRCISVRDRINEIKDCICPVREVDKIWEALKDMKSSASYLEKISVELGAMLAQLVLHPNGIF